MESYSRQEDRRVRVHVEASDFMCDGLVHLPGIRLSDVMNEKNEFLIVVDAIVTPLHPTAPDHPPQRYDTMFVRKGEIKYVVPLESRPPTDNRI